MSSSSDHEENDEWIDNQSEADIEDQEYDSNPITKKTKTIQEKDRQDNNRQEQKALLKERKLQKPNAPLIQKAKKLWEEIRQKKTEKSHRETLMKQMMDLVQGKALDIIFKHDASRIIQSCLKYGNTEQRDSIASELKGHYVEISKSQYGRFIVSKILNYCNVKYRQLVISEFYGKVRKLIKHKDAAIVLEEAYSQFANSKQRSELMQEFYGPEFGLFKSDNVQSIHELIQSHPTKKDSIIKHLGEIVNSILEKGTSSIAQISIIHRAILEYMQVAEEKAVLDLIEILKDHLVHILHTREGAKITQLCLLYSGPKNRKIILKSFKGYVVKIAKEQYGHAALISMFECVDDTVLLQKAILAELTKDGAGEESLAYLLRDKYASRVILYLLNGRNRKYQPSYLVKELQEMDVIRLKTSKKDDAIRQKQLLEALSPILLDTFEKNMNELCRGKQSGAVVVEGLKYLIGEKTSCIQELARIIAHDPLLEFNQEKDKEFHAVKKLGKEAEKSKLEEFIVLDDHLLVNRNATFVVKNIICSELQGIPTCQIIYNAIEDHFESWINYCISNANQCSGTAFVLLNLYEKGDDQVQKNMKTNFSSFKNFKDLSQFKVDKESSKKRKQGSGDSGLVLLLNALKK